MTILRRIMFRENLIPIPCVECSSNLCDSSLHSLQNPQIHLFENLVRPILLYGSDVWGVNVSANMQIDKLFFYYMRCVLHVKSTTSNIIVVGECGQLPTSVYCHISALRSLKRLSDLPDTKIAKQIYNGLDRLHQCGLKTRVTKAR